jgi:RNA polymerase-binding transcription factor DksA
MADAAAGPRTDLKLDHFREILGEERDRITDSLRKLDERNEAGGTAGEVSELAAYDQHPADQGTELFLNERDQAMEVSLKAELAQVERAWHHLEAGRYGLCERCGAKIPKGRLEAMPATTFCVECADQVETQV